MVLNLTSYFYLPYHIYTFLAYEYIQDSEITAPTLQSGSEEDLLEKVNK